LIRDITLGQYYQAESLLHRIDPRTKLFATLIYIISLFIYKNPYTYILAAAFLILSIKLSKVPVKFIVRGLKPILILMLFTVCLNIFMVKGEVIARIWKLSITKEGVENAIYMAVRLVLLVLESSILTLTTTPQRLTDGLEKGLGFLKKIKVPVHEISMMMSIALRFIPVLLEETDRIMKAQLARGADFESGNIIKKVKSLVPVVVPLFIASFKRAGDLAMAMETRCYSGGEGRTSMKPLKYTKTDRLIYLVVFVYIAAIIGIGILVTYLGK